MGCGTSKSATIDSVLPQLRRRSSAPGALASPAPLHATSHSDAANPQVMLSYRVPDTGAQDLGGDGSVFAAKAVLEAEGYTVFVGEAALEGGEKCGQRIQAAVLNCTAFIALCSPSYGESEWTFRECQLANQEGKPILPVWHSGPYPPPALKLYLSGLQCVPYGNMPLVECNFGDCMQQVLLWLHSKGCVPLQPTPQPLPVGSLVEQGHLPLQLPQPSQLPPVQQQVVQPWTDQQPASQPQALVSQVKPQTAQPITSQPQTAPLQHATPAATKLGLELQVQPQLQPPLVQLNCTSSQAPSSSSPRPQSSGLVKDVEANFLAACKKGDVATVQQLLEQIERDRRGSLADPDDKDGNTALHWAAEGGHTEVVHVLLRAGADKDDRNKSGYTPLYNAAIKGHTEVVQVLLQAGADKEAKQNADSWTPLHRAAEGGHTEVVQALLRAGADKEAKEVFGYTPLHKAAYYGHTEVVQVLLQAGADKEARDKDGCWTPLHQAANQGHAEVVQVLLRAGANEEAKDMGDETPLHKAAMRGHAGTVEALLRAGVDKEARNKSGYTPLHWAAIKGRAEVVHALLQAGADKEAKEMDGWTPLHSAAYYGHIEGVQALLPAGANKEARDKNGNTPIDLAKNEAITALLLQSC